ncbi:MAG: ABC transporter permease [Actinobacteria bacterium]|nr:ABC transporter permease [Actinomycetota bacterium]
MSYFTYVGKRLIQLLPVLFGISVFVFTIVHLIPGEPADVLLGQNATPARVAILNHKLGIDRPIVIQYLNFVWDAMHFSLGTSFYNKESVASLIIARLPATAMLLSGGVILSILIALPLSILAASKRGAWRDQIVRAVPIVGLGMPQVWVGIMLILLFGLKFPLFPVSGFGDTFTQHLRSVFLPSLSIAILLSPILIRSLRASMLEILDSDFILTARAKGISQTRITIVHVLRNAIIASVTVLGVNIAYLVGSTVIVERIFVIPGSGSLMIDAIARRDYPIVQGVTLFFAIVVVAVNLITDLIHAALDPRVALK